MMARMCGALGALLLSTAVGCAPRLQADGAFGAAQLERKPAPDFTLSDQRGAPYHLAEKRGREVVVFFGYTHCPDVCPTTLAALESGYRSALTPEQRAKVDIAFVTVDPARDTLPRMAKYVALFGPNVIGLRGTAAQLASMEHAWHVYHQIMPKTKTGYDVAHSATIFFIAPDGQIAGVKNASDGPEDLGKELAKDLT